MEDVETNVETNVETKDNNTKDNTPSLVTYIELGEQIAELERQRKEMRDKLAKVLHSGDTILHRGATYVWDEYMSKTTLWKTLYGVALRYLTEEGIVIVGEEEARHTKESGPHYRLRKKR